MYCITKNIHQNTECVLQKEHYGFVKCNRISMFVINSV
jgi:hypothetical protein